jgi:hypothetical protein
MPASSRPDGRLRAAIADVPADRRYLLEHLADWADMPERDGLVKLTSYRGKRHPCPAWPATIPDW